MNPISVYHRVLQVVEYFLKNAAHLTVKELQGYDPSVEELAQHIRNLAAIVGVLASSSYEDENMAINAYQCCIEMERLARIVRSGGDDAELELVFKNLEMYTRVP